MLEITAFLKRKKMLGYITNFFISSFFYSIRNIVRHFPYKTGNILVISLHRIGDTAFTVPAIREIQHFYSKSITILCYEESFAIYNLAFKNIGYCKVSHNDFFFGERIARRKVKKKVKKMKPEIIFDLTGVMRSAYLIYNLRALEIIGINREYFKSIYDNYSPIRNTPHSVDIYLDAVCSKLPSINRNLLDDNTKNITGNKKILIHPFAGWKAKEWGLNKFLELAKTLKNKYEVIIISPSNRITKELIDEVNNEELELFESKSLEDLISKIKDSALVIGCDSGPQHLAHLLGKSTFIIYGPTNPDYHKPPGDKHVICKLQISCSPRSGEKLCFTSGGRDGCPSYECMNKLSVKEVLMKLNTFISKINLNEKSIN
jgi:ADP-heptose:LPS heptosyltransferase